MLLLRTSVISLCRMLELLKMSKCIYHRHRLRIHDVLSHILQHLAFLIISSISRAKVRVSLDGQFLWPSLVDDVLFFSEVFCLEEGLHKGRDRHCVGSDACRDVSSWPPHQTQEINVSPSHGQSQCSVQENSGGSKKSFDFFKFGKVSFSPLILSY